MNMRQSAGWLAVIAALLTVNIIVQASRPADAGGVCESDITGDGEVGIDDFLQLLGEWGPCPPRVVAGVAFGEDEARQVQLWSDNTIRYRHEPRGFVCSNDCSENTPPLYEWVTITSPPTIAAPADVHANANKIWVFYADGTLYTSDIVTANPSGCNGDAGSFHCEITFGPWELIE